MHTEKVLAITAFAALLLSACSPPSPEVSDPEGETQAAPGVSDPEGGTQPTPEVSNPEVEIQPTPSEAPTSVTFPLSVPGPYHAGNRVYTIEDKARGGRRISLTIWYPALKNTDSAGRSIVRDASPDMSGAPYPLILTGSHSGDFLFQSHLASHGFVMAIVRYPDPIQLYWGFEMIDHPLDMLLSLDWIASNPPQGLEGMVDAQNTGVTGYSSDGSYSLALGGARIDPEFYLMRCGEGAVTVPVFSEQWCGLASNWQEFASHAGQDITAPEDGLWQPLSDERIRAVMPMAPNGAWLYGEQGLAAVDKPVLLINGTEDELVPYDLEATYIYEHLGMAPKTLISFVGKQHMMVMDAEPAAQLRHFAVAYFGYYLQGHEEYADLFSEDFISRFSDLAWGVYPGD